MSRSRKQQPAQRARGDRRRRGAGGKRRADENVAGFWGAPSQLPPARHDVRITDVPAATVRSLGPPPLPGHEVVAEHYFAAVYDRAVALAGALAAVGGLIEPDELVDRDGD
ncbi:MAG TPA: hypothetical protein VM324_14185 [Egibacteraceae bacterium]|nr:hypothetical protein [Egibacteraceae bacterium]